MILRDGQRFEKLVDFPKGSTSRPMDFSEVAGKFRSLALHAVAPDRAERIIEAVDRFERLDNIRELCRLLA